MMLSRAEGRPRCTGTLIFSGFPPVAALVRPVAQLRRAWRQCGSRQPVQRPWLETNGCSASCLTCHEKEPLKDVAGV